jgi:2-oxoisovalerate dehydrogenase E2 component (dihydrolipoyl transacylase)
MTTLENDADRPVRPQTAQYVFALPDLGEGLVSGEIIEWLIAAGDQVEVDQPVVVVETTKTTMELPAPYAGRVTQLHGAVADIVDVGAPLVTIEVAGGAVPGGPDRPVAHLVGHLPAADAGAGASALDSARRLPPKPAQERVAASPAIRRLARELNVDLRAVTGTGKGGAITREDVTAASGRQSGSAES